MSSTGVAGNPEEYFWSGDEAFWSKRWRTSSFEQYVRAAIRKTTTSNGVFGAKVMWGYMEHFLERLAATQRGAGLYGHKLLSEWLPNLRYVRISRRDHVAQAVSWARAIQSDVWHANDPPRGGALQFDFEQIDNLVKEIADHEASWDDYFDAAGVVPLHMFYEDFSADLEGTVAGILEYMGIERRHRTVTTELTRQRDSLNDEWAMRYRLLAE